MRYRFQSNDHVFEITLNRDGESLHAIVDEESYEIEILDSQPGQISLRFNGRPVTLYWASHNDQKWVSMDGCTYRLERPTLKRSTSLPAEAGGGEAIRAPMPAQVRAVQVMEGDPVDKGQTLLLLEAMKMEIRIKAPGPGKVTKLRVQAGQVVEKDQVLVQIGA